MSGPDLLGWGPDEPTEPPPPRTGWSQRMTAAARRRRWTGVAGTVVLGAAAAVLAFQAGADPEAPPPPEPTRTFAVEPPVQTVTEVAFGTKWAFALVSACVGPEDTRQCRYRLARRPLSTVGTWTLTAVQTGPVAGAGGLPRLFVEGDRITVVDQPTVGNVYTSPDGGKTMTVQGLSSGPPVPAVLRGDIVDLALCESCVDRLTLLEPRTGRLRELAEQPLLTPATGVRSFARSPGVLWALGDGGGRLTSAVSLDGGRTWRRLPVGAAGGADLAFLVPDGGRGLFLVVSRDTDPQVVSEFSELWRIGDPARPGAAWEQVTPAGRPKSIVGLVVSAGTPLFQDETGRLHRLDPGGGVRPLPTSPVDGLRVAPAMVVAGPGTLLLAIADDPASTGTPHVLLSRDGGITWEAEQLP